MYGEMKYIDFLGSYRISKLGDASSSSPSSSSSSSSSSHIASRSFFERVLEYYLGVPIHLYMYRYQGGGVLLKEALFEKEEDPPISSYS